MKNIIKKVIIEDGVYIITVDKKTKCKSVRQLIKDLEE